MRFSSRIAQRPRYEDKQSGSFLSFSAGRNALYLFLILVGLLRVYHMSESNLQLFLPDSKEDDYLLAKRQSLGFFDDIASSQWQRMQKKFVGMSPNFCRGRMKPERGSQFWQCHYEPDFVCQHEERIGNRGDGGKWTCDPHRIAKKVEAGGSCLIYSIGSNNKYGFELGVQKEIHKDCEIHTFDFGDYGADAKKIGVEYHQWGLGADSTDGKFKSLSTTVEDLGHQNREIDIFKIDCEGCEWETAVNWFDTAAKHNIMIRQIQVELHGYDAGKIHAFFDLMYEHGYVIFHKEPNLLGASCIEYAFLKLDPEFVNAASRTKGVDALARSKKKGKK